MDKHVSWHRPRRLPFLSLAIGLAVAACASPDPGSSYLAGVESARRAKDDAFGAAADSPIPAEKRMALLPLPYFPPDQDYRVPASLNVEQSRGQILQMLTSTGQLRPMQKVGMLQFSLKGRPLSLGAFVEQGTASLNRLFVPFTDLTNGTETYPAGRYLDLDVTVTGIYLLDFNRAYNPLCAYNPTYDCPYPPRENRLPVPVRAGEKSPRAN
jgi:hypothetical protein